MSRENVDTLRRILELVFDGRPLGPELLAEDAEWVNPADAVETGTRRGAEGFNAAIENVFATWDDVRFDTERLIDNGDEVVALGVLRGHVHAAGMEVDSPHGEVWTFRDGRATRMRWFNTHREALEASALEE
jgi:ketosteroid isomerase-like protein